MPEWVHVQLDLLALPFLYGFLSGNWFLSLAFLYLSGLPFAYYTLLENRHKSLPEIEVEKWETDLTAPLFATGSWFFFFLAYWDNRRIDAESPR